MPSSPEPPAAKGVDEMTTIWINLPFEDGLPVPQRRIDALVSYLYAQPGCGKDVEFVVYSRDDEREYPTQAYIHEDGNSMTITGDLARAWEALVGPSDIDREHEMEQLGNTPVQAVEAGDDDEGAGVDEIDEDAPWVEVYTGPCARCNATTHAGDGHEGRCNALLADKDAVAIIRAAARGQTVRYWATGYDAWHVRSLAGLVRQMGLTAWRLGDWLSVGPAGRWRTADADVVAIWLGHIADGDWSPDQPTPWEVE